MPLPFLTTKIVDMTGFSPASFHDLLSNDDLLMEDSSVRDVSLWECAMADVQGP
jgi:RNAse (barnase) inhibitor barstar